MIFFFFNDTATTEIYTLSLHDALPIYRRRASDSGTRPARRARTAASPRPPSRRPRACPAAGRSPRARTRDALRGRRDRKSTRLNSSHSQISYAVFCLKKKNHRQRCSRYEYRQKVLEPATAQCQQIVLRADALLTMLTLDLGT